MIFGDSLNLVRKNVRNRPSSVREEEYGMSRNTAFALASYEQNVMNMSIFQG